MKNTFILPLGDPFGEGHRDSTNVLIRSNKTSFQIIRAYEQSCNKTGLTFTRNNTISTSEGIIDHKHPEYEDRNICTQYGDHTLSDLASSILKKHGINLEVYGDHIELINLFMEFIKIHLKDLKFEITEKYLNTLNLAIGYGLFNTDEESNDTF